MDNSNQTPSIPKSGPKDVFLHLMVFVALYSSVVSIITLLFQYVDFWHPDPLTFYYTSVLNAIRWSASALVVMFPVYILVSWLINKDVIANPEKKSIKIRKWLTYLTLFASALTIIIDIITLLYNFLGGELTLSFFLKIIVVFLVAGAVFGYYIWDLRKDANRKKLKLFAWGLSLLILAVIVSGFFIVGSPTKQRSMKFDERRINNLQILQNEIVSFWNQKNALPATLTDLNNSISGFSAPKDPQTNLDYGYKVKSNLSFELCANFKLPSIESSAPTTVPRSINEPYNQNWKHGAGQVCFERVIDPQRDKTLLPAVPMK